MSIHVGFTGTRKGMATEQHTAVERLLRLWQEAYAHCTFHHGDCIGADVQAAALARKAGMVVHGHPGPGGPTCGLYSNDVTLPPQAFLARDKAIVACADVMLATPKGMAEEEYGSGTWHTIRFARAALRPLCIVWPDGSTTRERWRSAP